MVYDKLELIHPEKHQELIDDLDIRFGIKGIENIKVGRIDAVKNSARLQINFKDPINRNFSENS